MPRESLLAEEYALNVQSRQAEDVEFLANRVAELVDTMRKLLEVEKRRLRTLQEIERKL